MAVSETRTLNKNKTKATFIVNQDQQLHNYTQEKRIDLIYSTSSELQFLGKKNQNIYLSIYLSMYLFLMHIICERLKLTAS